MVESLTKRVVDEPALDAMLRAAIGVGCRIEGELVDGWFNTAYRVRLSDGRAAIAKIAPPPEVPVLRYERGIMATEALVYRLAGGRDGIPLPELLYADDEFMVLSVLDGEPWDKATLPAEAGPVLLRQLGAITARLHEIVAPDGLFGYPAPQAGLRAPTWRAAFTAMVAATVDDARRWNTPFGVPGNEVLDLVAGHAAVLDEVRTPRLVHFDLWPGNVFVAADGPRVTGLIDHERAFWGDPVAELVSLEFCGSIEPDGPLLTGYREAGGHLDGSVTARLALYRLYLDLILVTECGPRGYDEARAAWTRDRVAASVAALTAASR